MVPASTADAPPGDGQPPSGSDDQTSRPRRIPDLTNLLFLGLLSIPGFFVEALSQLRVFALFFFFGFWPFVTLLVSSRDDSPAAWVQTGDRWTTVRFILSMLVLQVNPYVQVQSIRQLAGNAAVSLRYRFDLPDPNSFDQKATYRLPVEGEWTVVNGSHEKESSHSWSIFTQRYAYDFVKTDEEGRTHSGSGSDRADYYCWDEPILAPADGTVVAASDGHRDAPRTGGWLDLRQRDIRGNYVVIKHASQEYSVLAHLREGSVAVDEGDRVVAGQQIGRCGHSGNSTEPHLHFHVQDGVSFFTSMGLPIVFSNVDIAGGPEASLRQREEASLTAGQRVRQRLPPTTDSQQSSESAPQNRV